MKDITDQRFTRLIAIEPTNRRCGSNVIWRCICDCGTECFVNSGSLGKGNTKSCGCLWLERITTHGMTITPEYRAWKDMIQRCENPNTRAYKNYGGRGITVSEEFHDFEVWYEHIGLRPGPEHTLERKDNDGNYESGNCCWATRKEQRANTRPISCGPRKQHLFVAMNFEGTMLASNNQHEFARQHGLTRGNISSCLHGKLKQHKGWRFAWM